MDRDTIVNYVPEAGTEMEYKSHVSSFCYKNENGKETSEGRTADLHNKNGNVKEQVDVFKTGP